ncbi:glycosyltransferase [Providencia rettgeri]|uniref:glycosyltransferase n=1 Tax=Providencia rettgeri TaxID=587 RepID=UPI001E41012A|nr:glycosyltransferase [Providencia rettgeri]UEK59490.1 glycosyltransferase [Providencia rettgeri]
MKTILVISPLSSGHMQKWIHPICKDYKFIFFTLHNAVLPDDFIDCKIISFPRMTNTRLDFVIAIPYLQFVIIKNKPDLIFSCFLSSYGLMTSFVKTKCKKILSVWGTDVNGKTLNNKLINFLVKKAKNKFDWINSPAFHIKKKLVGLGFSSNQIDVFQYGINLSDYKIKKYKNTNPPIKLLSIRNWDDLYNIDYIIKEYSLFCSSSKIKSELTIIGKGPSDRKQKLLDLISSLDFSNGKVSIAGFLDKNTLIETYCANNAIISVPSMDGTPLSVLESMFVGLVPIVSNIDANHEWLNKSTAFFCTPNEPYSLMHAIDATCNAIIDNKHFDLIKANREKVIKHGDYTINTKRLADKIKSLIN